MPRLIGLPTASSWAYLAQVYLSKKEIPLLPVLNGPLIFLVNEEERLEEISSAFSALIPLFPNNAKLISAIFGEDHPQRLKNLSLINSDTSLFVLNLKALESKVPSPQFFRQRTLAFLPDTTLNRDEAAQNLIQLGYLRSDFVESPGDFAIRGAILDFYSPNSERPTRILFDGNKIASLRSFDPGTQMSSGTILKAQAVPASSESAQVDSTPLSEWFGQSFLSKALWIAEEGLILPANFTAPENRWIWAGRLLETSSQDLDFGAKPNPPTGGIAEQAFKEIQKLNQEGFKVFIYSLNQGENSRIQEIFPGSLKETCQFLIGEIGNGFRHSEFKVAFYSSSEIFNRRYRRALSYPPLSPVRLHSSDLQKGDYVVHRDYGIARYGGLQMIRSPGFGQVECARLSFAGDSVLYLPMSEFSSIQKYTSGSSGRPRLSSLDQRRWEEIKERVREGVRELAEKLLKTQAERASSPGYAFPKDSPLEGEFAEEFPYQETPDQARAIAEVLEDMSKPQPMDRLVLGDVGFGKTEVAMRASFKCAMGNKQTCVLVPTTILAEQHFRSFSKRFADYPISLGLLTRFQSPSEQKSVIEKLKEGRIDIVIGTARLLQKDIRFKDLGLAIIDEEHRFGVEDKEKIKRFRTTLDVLSLSATPIPRTFGQALSGLRSLSFIQSAPAGRLPITTRILPWSEETVISAIEEEIARGGQAYYVHNRVRTLKETAERLKDLMPSTRFVIVHGQMKGSEIENAMWDFYKKKFDVLLASTIIESGLDIPSVNTLLVEDAHEFGLAQLYQLRGRIGRESKKAFCYFLYPKDTEFSRISEEAQKRLEALKEFGHLGSGAQLAMRDMEIRGTGDLLGRRQHGFVRDVGISLYSQLLTEEVSSLQKKSPSARFPTGETTLDLPLSAFIPQDYFPEERQRLELYRRLSSARKEDLETLKKEMEDLAGPLPEPVINLFNLIRIKISAAEIGIIKISQRKNELELIFGSSAKITPEQIQFWTQKYSQDIRFTSSKQGDGLIISLKAQSALEWLIAFFEK